MNLADSLVGKTAGVPHRRSVNFARHASPVEGPAPDPETRPMSMIPPTHDRSRPTSESLPPKPAMSVIQCQWIPEPTLPNVDNVNPAMSDFQTAQWVERVVRGHLLSLIGMPPAVDCSEPGPGIEQLRALRGRFPVKRLDGAVDTEVAPFADTPANQRALRLGLRFPSGEEKSTRSPQPLPKIASLLQNFNAET